MKTVIISWLCFRLVTERAPEESPTGSPGTVTRPLCPTQDGTGSQPETTAGNIKNYSFPSKVITLPNISERGAWIWSVSRTKQSRTLLDSRWPELEWGRCGAVGGCVTKRSMVATSLGSSPTTSEDGSGPPPWPPWARPTCSMAGSSMDGPTLVQMAVLSQMVSSSRTVLVTKLVWLFWTTSSMTVSNGTIPSMIVEKYFWF